MQNRFIKDLIIYLPSQFLPALTAFITTPILTRLLLPAEYGFWAQATSISALLVALVVSGFSNAAIRFYPAYKIRSTLKVYFATLVVSTGVVVLVVSATSIFIIILLKKFQTSQLYSLSTLVILIFVSQSIFTVFISVLRAKGNGLTYTIFQLMLTYGGLGFGLVLAGGLSLGVEGLMCGTFLATLIILPFLILYSTRGVGIHSQYFQIKDALQFWRYAWPLTLGNVAMWALRVSDLFIIGYFRSAHDVGLYSVSYSISSKSIELLVALFLLSFGPLIINTFETSGREATEKTIKMVTRIYLILCLPAAIGLSVLAFPFVALLTTPDYLEGGKIVGFVVLSSFIWGLAQIAMMGTVIKKQTRPLAFNQIVAAATHICLQLLLVNRFGYVASAVSTLIGYTVLLVLQTLSSKPYLRWLFPFSTLRNVMAASIVMGLTAWGIYRISGAGTKGSAIYLFLSIFVSVIIYVVCLWLFGEIEEDEKNMVMQMWFRLKGLIA